jgi:hypothetical protein
MEGVKVHYDSAEPGRVGAEAFAHGPDIHLAPGAERHLPHEAWHIVQQRQGRVPASVQFKGLAVNIDPALEGEADAMGKRAAAQPRPAGRRPEPRAAAGTGQRGVAQFANMLVIAGAKAAEDLVASVAREEKQLGLSAIPLPGADFSAVTASDTIYLTGKHGDKSSYGGFKDGKLLAGKMFRRKLRQCKAIVLTGCETGGSFAAQVFDELKRRGVAVGEVVAPAAASMTTKAGGISADSQAAARLEKLKEDRDKMFDFMHASYDKEMADLKANKAALQPLRLTAHILDDAKAELDKLDAPMRPPNQPTSQAWTAYKAAFAAAHAKWLNSAEDSARAWISRASAAAALSPTETALAELRKRKPLVDLYDLSAFFPAAAAAQPGPAAAAAGNDAGKAKK